MRGIVAVCAFVLLTLAAAPNPSAQPQRSEAAANKPKAAPPVAGHAQSVEPIQPPEYYQPCRQDRRNYRSDLCAQWSAAQGAIDAAYWAKWGFWLSLTGLFGLVGTLFYTRKAVLAAEEGTKDADAALSIAKENAGAAADQVKVAQDTAHRQLRPYVYLVGVKMDLSEDSLLGHRIPDKAPIVLWFKNFGQTPAKHVTLRAKVFVGGIWNEPFDVSYEKITPVYLGDMPPGFQKDRDGYTLLDIGERYTDIAMGIASAFVCGVLEYSDGTPGRPPYKSEFRLASTDKEFLAEKFSPTPTGNESD